MSLTQKCEAAALKVIQDAALFTGRRYESREPGDETLDIAAGAVIAEASIVGEGARDRKGMSTGNKWVRLLVWIISPADAQAGDAATPDVLHAGYVDAVRDSIHLDDIADRLTNAQVDFHVYAVMPDTPPALRPVQRRFQEVFSFRLFACENDMT